MSKRNMFRSFVFGLIKVMQVACNSLLDTGLSQTSGYGYLVLKFESNRSKVRASESVQMRFTVTNTGSAAVTIESQDTPVLDIIVRDPGLDQILTSWSSQHPDQIYHRIEWKPGESKILELTWIPTTEQQSFGRRIDTGGMLYDLSRIVQSASVRICLGTCY